MGPRGGGPSAPPPVKRPPVATRSGGPRRPPSRRGRSADPGRGAAPHPSRSRRIGARTTARPRGPRGGGGTGCGRRCRGGGRSCPHRPSAYTVRPPRLPRGEPLDHVVRDGLAVEPAVAGRELAHVGEPRGPVGARRAAVTGFAQHATTSIRTA